MLLEDLIIALQLHAKDMESQGRQCCIDKIENYFIYLSNGTRIPFRDIPEFMEKTGRI